MENGKPKSEYDETYSKIENIFGSEPEEILVEFQSLIDKSHSVLDIGAGQGRNSLFLANSGFSVHAIDPSQIAIQQLERISQKKRFEIKCQCIDFQGLQETEHRYSGILVFGLVQLLDKQSLYEIGA